MSKNKKMTMAAKKTAQIYLIYFLVVLYALCYQLQSPIEPFLVDKLVGEGGDAAAQYARLQSFFSVVQTVGSLLFGYILDIFGLRVGFAVNFLGCALQYYALANTTTLGMLFASKVPGGVGIAVSQCPYLSDYQQLLSSGAVAVNTYIDEPPLHAQQPLPCVM